MDENLWKESNTVLFEFYWTREKKPGVEKMHISYSPFPLHTKFFVKFLKCEFLNFIVSQISSMNFGLYDIFSALQ